MPTRDELKAAIAAEIADYRAGEIAAPNADHVERWIAQFPGDIQDSLLAETLHVLKQLYLTKANVTNFLDSLASEAKIAGENPAEFWKHAAVLRIQKRGSSQKEMVALFDEVLRSRFGVGAASAPSPSGVYVYLDDAVYSGGHLRSDVLAWINNDAPEKFVLHVIVMAVHTYGEYYATKAIREAATNAKKDATVHVWRCLTLEDRKAYTASSDVLRPSRVPDDVRAQAYANELTQAGYPPVLRTGDSVGSKKVFSSPAGRELLEQEFLKAGVRVREQCPYLHDTMRPLGFSGLKTLGFGSLLITHRNCSNNCPLALWAGDPWYPLLPRRTNTTSSTTWP
jgi:hypothetical protein